MKKIKFTLVFILLSSIIYSQNIIPDLIVEKGQIKKLATGSHVYNRVHIKEGAILNFIEESSTWAVINCKEFILEGSIVFNRFKSGIGNIKATTNDGFLLEYKFPESSIGGKGGNGGRHGLKFAGKGFKSKNRNGGGGGAGTQSTRNASSHGDDAINYQGAEVILNTAYSSGGDGGRSGNNHGGLLSINTIDFISNGSSWISLNGENGKNGNLGSFFNYDKFSSGGGGGGSAGGDGGVLIVRADKYIGNLPKINIAGGIGGVGGKGGDSFQTYGFGLKGENGENGKNGYVDWLQK